MEQVKVEQIAMRCQAGHEFLSPGVLDVETHLFGPRLRVCPRCGLAGYVCQQEQGAGQGFEALRRKVAG